jgi:hypothetical protein
MGDFHRLNSAAANESRANSQSNQAICALFFFKQALRMWSMVALPLVGWTAVPVVASWT